jgi:hypothetical protein
MCVCMCIFYMHCWLDVLEKSFLRRFDCLGRNVRIHLHCWLGDFAMSDLPYFSLQCPIYHDISWQCAKCPFCVKWHKKAPFRVLWMNLSYYAFISVYVRFRITCSNSSRMSNMSSKRVKGKWYVSNRMSVFILSRAVSTFPYQSWIMSSMSDLVKLSTSSHMPPNMLCGWIA